MAEFIVLQNINIRNIFYLSFKKKMKHKKGPHSHHMYIQKVRE